LFFNIKQLNKNSRAKPLRHQNDAAETHQNNAQENKKFTQSLGKSSQISILKLYPLTTLYTHHLMSVGCSEPSPFMPVYPGGLFY
jgi:hypothetical protein